MMRQTIYTFIFLMAAIILLQSCNNDKIAGGTSETESPGTAKVSIALMDAPGNIEGIQAVNINIEEISFHHADSGWLTMARPDSEIDFLKLINGITHSLGELEIPSGHYTQIRLQLGPDNTLIIDDTSHLLELPDKFSSGIKINLNFEFEPGGTDEMLIDFNIGKSIITAGDKFKLQPVFSAFKSSEAGTISGTVTLENNEPALFFMVRAQSGNTDVSTYTDVNGQFTFIIPAGTYKVLADPLPDQTYRAVTINAGESVTGLDFHRSPP